MQKLVYEELRNLTTGQIETLTSSQKRFVVVTDPTKGAYIARFLEREQIFHASVKSLRSRFRYLRTAWVGFLIPDFIHLWSASVNRGYAVTVIRQADICEVSFFC